MVRRVPANARDVQLPITYYELYRRLRKQFGYLDWWPGDTRDEIIIGAILTQQTSWKNVEKALENLRKDNSIDLRKISGMGLARLQRLIRPSGFYRQKARRLKALCAYIFSDYANLDSFLGRDRATLRKELLGLNGVGKETADSIMLYAAEKRVFVVDAYTRRITGRVYGVEEDMDYDRLAGLISDSIPASIKLYKDFHAQLVELGKRYCRPRPLCAECPINEHCAYFISLSKDR